MSHLTNRVGKIFQQHKNIFSVSVFQNKSRLPGPEPQSASHQSHKNKQLGARSWRKYFPGSEIFCYDSIYDIKMVLRVISRAYLFTNN